MGACGGKNKLSQEEQQIREAFDKIDLNKSGVIDKNELATLINELATKMKIAKPTQQDIDKAMQAIDINQDGKINFAEYKKFIQTALKKDQKQ